MSAPVRTDRPSEIQGRIIVAVLACERVMGGLPDRRAIEQVVSYGDESLPSRLVTAGWLEAVPAEGDGRWALYRVTAKARERYERRRREALGLDAAEASAAE